MTAVTIKTPAKYEVLVVIQGFTARIMSKRVICNWARSFKSGPTNIHGEERSGLFSHFEMNELNCIEIFCLSPLVHTK